MSPPRLLVFSHSANFGGSEKVLLQLIRELKADRRVSCTVVVPDDGPLPEVLRSEGVEVWVWATSWWCGSDPVDPERTRRILAAGAAEVLHKLGDARSLDPNAILSITTVIPWGALTAALLGKPHLWYVTDFGGATDHPPDYFLPFEDIRRTLQTGADRPFVVSRAVRDRLFHDAAEPPPVIYPHLPTPPVEDTGPRSDGGPTVLTVFGVVRPSKGQREAVQAVAELARRGIATELVLVGYADPGVEEVQELARTLGVEDRVRLVGTVPDQHPWMARSGIVLVPSHEETFSLVGLEAHLHAKPLVVTRVGGIVEYVQDGVNGLTVPVGDPQALASAVERLVREPDLARRLGDEGRKQAIERFTAERFSGEVRRLLEEVVADGRRCGIPAPLVAPLESLAAQHHALDLALEGARARLARAEEERDEAVSRLGQLSEALRAERERCERAEEKARALADGQARVARTRAWRLVQAYWRLAGRFHR